jgi:uncharacterized protein (DUF433 family)
VNEKDDAKDRVREVLGEMPPKKVMQDMRGDQVDDLMVGVQEMDLPESVKERMMAAMEKKAREAGYPDLDAFMEDHPEGVHLTDDPISIRLTDEERDAVLADEALLRQQPDRHREAVLDFYHAVVSMHIMLNTRNGELAEVDPELMSGKPCVRGSRVPIDMVIAMLAEKREDGRHCSVEDVVDEYDFLTPEEVRDAIKFAALCVRPRLMAEAIVALNEDADEEDDA